MSADQVKKIAKQYADVLKKHDISFLDIYLFGSYAQGKASADSDIDLALVVSNIPSQKAYMNTKMTLWKLASLVDSRIEPILLEKKDFGKDATTMAHEVQTTGIRIK